MATRTIDTPIGKVYRKGQRLYCAHCGSEIEVINPCTCNPPTWSFRCCGEEMRPSVGADVHLGVEGEPG
jgi:hypothetical protein